MAYKNEKVKIPIIDFCKADLKPGTPQWESTKVEVFKALEEFGGFEAIYDKVSNEIREAVFDSLEQTLPLVNKLSEYLKKPYDDRYEGKVPHLPFYENRLHKADLMLPQSVQTFANTFWPDGNPQFCNLMETYYKPIVELDEMVKMMVVESLGLEKYMEELLNSSNAYYLRLTKYYKAAHHEANKIGLPSHVDSSFLTIIKQNEVGMQALTKNDEWIEFGASPNSYIVISADSFMAWTNGRLPSVTHRVTMEGDADRLSIQLFSLPIPGYVVEAPKELVDEDHPSLFKPFDIFKYFKYLTSRTKPGGVGLKFYQEVCS